MNPAAVPRHFAADCFKGAVASRPEALRRILPGDAVRLLVSVRNRDEAELAIEAGVELVDVKDPSQGSLGRPSETVVRQIAALREQLSSQAVLSVALGELHDWDTLTEWPPGNGFAGVDYVKLGLAGAGSDSDWAQRWRVVRDRVCEGVTEAPQWVAVAYADWEAANAPRPPEVIAAASAARCAGVLLDTWSKQAGGLLQHLSARDVHELVDAAHDAGLFCALAGQLRLGDLEVLRGCGAEVIAVRSAVCEQGDRQRRLSGDRLRQWCEALRRPGD